MRTRVGRGIVYDRSGDRVCSYDEVPFFTGDPGFIRLWRNCDRGSFEIQVVHGIQGNVEKTVAKI